MSVNSHSYVKKLIQTQLQENNKSTLQQAFIHYQNASLESYQIQNNFKILANPLETLKNHTIQNLIKQTNHVSLELNKQKSQTQQFSKNIYKNSMLKQGFDDFFKDHPLLTERKHNQISQNELLRNQKQNRKKAIIISDQKSLQKILQSKQLLKKFHQNFNKTKNDKNYYDYKIINKEINQQERNTDLKFSQINSIQHDLLTQNDHNLLLIKKLLQPHQIKHNYLHNQSFDIVQNKVVDKMFKKIFVFQLIKQDDQFQSQSQEFYFDFCNNLQFWKRAEQHDAQNYKTLIGQKINKNRKTEQTEQNEQQIIPNFIKFQMKNISCLTLYDFAMRKITPILLKSYFNIKEKEKILLKNNQLQQNIQSKYQQLQLQYFKAQQNRSKNKNRMLPNKLVNNQCQTLEQINQFTQSKIQDNYVSTQQIFKKIQKLNQLRQKRFKDPSVNQQKYIIIKNICLDIKNLLSKLLVSLLKNEKFFFQRKEVSLRQRVPYFTYADLLQYESQEQAQSKILGLVLKNFVKFQVQEVDEVSKRKIFQIFSQQKQRNQRILKLFDQYE